MGVKIKPILIQLIKETRAQKKKNFELYRPTGIGAGAFGYPNNSESDRILPRDEGKDDQRKGSDRGDDSSKPSVWSGDESKDKSRVAPGDMVRTGVGMMISGGMIGATGGSTSIPGGKISAPRVM